MIVTCQNCNKKYRIKEKSISEKGKKFKCKKCDHAITVFPTKNGFSLKFDQVPIDTTSKKKIEVPKSFDQYFYFDGLAPQEALKLISGTSAKKVKGEFFQYVRISHADFVLGLTTSVIFPDVYSERGLKKAHKAQEAILDELMENYKKIKGINTQPVRNKSIEGTMPFLEGLVWLLLNSTESSENAIDYETDRYLIVAKNIARQRAWEIFDELYYNATHIELTSGKNEEDHYFLYEVLDDHARKSSFLSAVAGHFFHDCTVLKCFSSNNYEVFLPKDIKPTEYALSVFCSIFKNIPEFFGRKSIEPDQSKPVRLISIIPVSDLEESDTFKCELLNLIGLHFFNQVNFMPQMITKVDFSLYDLFQSQDNLNQLREMIDASDPPIGYQLELKKAQTIIDIDTERFRLLDKQSEIDYKLAYLDSISEPKPILLRFTQAQLPVLADILRSFPVTILREGTLQYGFQSTKDHPSGLHFILIDPSKAQMTEKLDPLLLWLKSEDPPIRFWLDPSWGRYYHGVGNVTLVFVPEYTCLSPVMHGWDVENMDEYLKQVMKRWFHGKHGVAEIPEKPIYIFEGSPQPGKEIEISILNQENLQPLITRLGWLNDNLTIIDDIGNETILEEMAADITGQSLANSIKDRSQQAIESFELVAEKTGKTIAEKLGVLSKVCTEEIDQLVTKTNSTIDEIFGLKKQLSQFISTKKDIENVHKDINKHKEDTEKNSKQLENEMDRLEKNVNSSLSKAKSKLEQIEVDIFEKTKDLKETRKRLQREIRSLSRK